MEIDLETIKWNLRKSDYSKVANRTNFSKSYVYKVLSGIRYNIEIILAAQDVALANIAKRKEAHAKEKKINSYG